MSLALLDWRRGVAAIYSDVRATADANAGHELWRQRRQLMQSEHPASADQTLRLAYADYDPTFRAELDVDTDVEATHIEIATATDGVVPYDRFGVVRHPKIGELSLWWIGTYGGGVWLPLRDPSPATYGGGRYLLDTIKGSDLGGDIDPRTGKGTLVVDANFAYNPSCAYDEAWACPLPPPGNVTSVEVAVGELLPIR